jgi:hypothetical protein
MKRFSAWHSLKVLISSLALAACGAETITAPKIATEASPGLVSGLLGGLVPKDALTRTQALPRDITVSAVIGSEGGTLSIPAAGFQLTIPRNAVTGPTHFTVTALKGKLVAYEFGPHGIQFKKSLQARQDLDATEWRLLALKPLIAGYFLDKSDLDQRGATALVAEVIKGITVPLTKQFSFQIDHFSGYIVAW